MKIKHALNRTFCVAPMLDCTDRHERYLLRLISKHAVLYTEMVTTGALIHGDRNKFLTFNQSEHPVALQLGGSNASDMAHCAELAQQAGFDEVNINVGCPSDRVQSGSFGACLMLTPEVVAESIMTMTKATDIPITVKCRIGVDDQSPKDALWQLVEQCATAGCGVFIVHARKAWLKGLSPKQNRDVPPLDYNLVYQLKDDFPELEIIINGGITRLEQCDEHLRFVDGVMLGREVYSNPYSMAGVDQRYYAELDQAATRDDVLFAYIDYVRDELANGVRLNQMSRHAVGLFHGEPSARLWRRHISENAHLPGANETVLMSAYEKMLGIQIA